MGEHPSSDCTAFGHSQVVVMGSVEDTVEALELTFLKLLVGRLPLPLRLVGAEDCRIPCVAGPGIS